MKMADHVMKFVPHIPYLGAVISMPKCNPAAQRLFFTEIS
jgi:hypothetical protein